MSRGLRVIAVTLVCVIATSAGAQITAASNGGASAKAMHDAYFAPFSEKTGIPVSEDTFNQELARLRSQVDTGQVFWDVVSVTAINAATGCEEELLERIDWSAYFDPADFQGAGGFGDCAIPNLMVSGGLVYDGKVFPPDAAPKSWADFWDVEKFPGKRGMLYRAEQTLEVALMADGVPPAEVMDVLSAPGGVDRAFNKLAELKPYIHWWKSGDESMQLLLTGEVVMTFGWNGRVASTNKSNGSDLKIEFNAGHVSGSQYFAVMAGAPNKEKAIEAIRFASGPGPQAKYSSLMHYAPANAKAYPLMSQEDLATLPQDHLDKASFQSGETYLSFWLNNGDALLQRFLTFSAQ